jgi:deazaflavin-dependent oxidoreductase (nitroreductase family)
LTSPAEQLNQRAITEFRANHGRVGGNFAGAPLLLIHTVGARSGQPRVNPVMYLADGDRYLVCASRRNGRRPRLVLAVIPGPTLAWVHDRKRPHRRRFMHGA